MSYLAYLWKTPQQDRESHTSATEICLWGHRALWTPFSLCRIAQFSSACPIMSAQGCWACSVRGAINGLMNEMLEVHLKDTLVSGETTEQQRKEELAEIAKILKSYLNYIYITNGCILSPVYKCVCAIRSCQCVFVQSREGFSTVFTLQLMTIWDCLQCPDSPSGLDLIESGPLIRPEPWLHTF